MKPHALILSALLGGSVGSTHLVIAQETVAGVSLPADSTAVALSDTLSIPTYDLDELVVSARKDIVRTDGANITYDLDADDSTNGLSLLEALRKVPFVTVDGQDNIKIKGDSNIRILVNGREDKMIEANASTILKAMPADAVASVEVITEPGAKYDAEGVGGILNLVTERPQTRYGYSGTASIGVSNQMYMANILGSVKVKNINADANFTYGNNAGLGQENITAVDSYDYNSISDYLQREDARQKVSFRFMSANLNMSWQPDKSNLFSWGGSWTNMRAGIDEYTSETSVWSREGSLTRSMFQSLTGDIANTGATAHASWRHDLDDSGHRLILAYGFNFGKTGIYTDSETTGIRDYSAPEPWQTNNTANYNREHTVQIDYSNPFGGRTHLLEAGVKGVFRRNSAFGHTGSGPAPDMIELIPSSLVSTSQLQDIYALYAAYTGNFGSWATSAGLRYEHTRMGMNIHAGDYEDFRSYLNDIVPNASVSYSFSPAHTLRLAYNMRISRPGIEQLNPYRLLLSNQIKEGNPDLRSERNNTLSLSYTNFGRVLGGSLSASYSRTSNSIQYYQEYSDGIIYGSFGNFGVKQVSELNGFLNINILSRMQLSLNAAANYTDIKDPKAHRGNHGWGGNWGANWSYTGPFDMKFGAYGGQGFHNITLSGYFSGWYYYGISISRDFLKDKSLNVALNANNFLSKYSHFTSVSWGEGWHRTDRTLSRNWNVGLTLTWNFGKLQEKAKTSGLDISTDDRVNSSKSSASSIGL